MKKSPPKTTLAIRDEYAVDLLKSGLSPKELHELSDEALANKIRDCVDLAQRAADEIMNRFDRAIYEALRTGQYLIEVKRRCPHGTWLKWLESHNLPLSSATVYRYMDLARKFSRVRNLSDVQSLRQAYFKLGVMREESAQPQKKPKDLNAPGVYKPTDFIASIKSQRNFWRVSVSRINLQNMSQDQIKGLATEIDALKETFESFSKEIEEALAKKSKTGGRVKK